MAVGYLPLRAEQRPAPSAGEASQSFPSKGLFFCLVFFLPQGLFSEQNSGKD